MCPGHTPPASPGKEGESEKSQDNYNLISISFTDNVLLTCCGNSAPCHITVPPERDWGGCEQLNPKFTWVTDYLALHGWCCDILKNENPALSSKVNRRGWML